MPSSTGLLNYSTTVPVDRTLSEMQAMLGRAGAGMVSVEYLDGVPSALAFALETPYGRRYYTLPCDRDAVLRVLRDTDPRLLKASKVKADPDQAARVAWRVLKDWLEAQLALIRTQMVELDQVMLPYLHVGDGRTLYQTWRDSEAKALPARDA